MTRPEQKTLTLPEVAARLGVHYMTAYRYIRTGVLAAEKHGGDWQVDEREVERLLQTSERTPGSDSSTLSTRRKRLEDRLVAGDDIGAWSVIESALVSGVEPAEVHLELIAASMRSIGERWAAGSIRVADEHLASLVARRLTERLSPRFNRRGRKNGRVLIGAVSGERHELPLTIVGDQLREDRFDVVNLGADTPAAEFASAAGEHRPDLVMVCATWSGRRKTVDATVRAIRAVSDAPVLAGGAALRTHSEAARLGADGWSGVDARSAVAAARARVRNEPDA